MRVRYFAVSAVAATLATLGAPGLAPWAGAAQHRPAATLPVAGLFYDDLCDSQSTPQCIQDPSDGGIGTTVVTDTVTSLESFDWAQTVDSGRCGGSVTSTCPFANTGIDSFFKNDLIVVLKQAVTGDCLRMASTAGPATMGACDTGSEPSTAWVTYVPFVCGCVEYVGVKITNDNGQATILTATGEDKTLFGGSLQQLNTQLWGFTGAG